MDSMEKKVIYKHVCVCWVVQKKTFFPFSQGESMELNFFRVPWNGANSFRMFSNQGLGRPHNVYET